MSLGTTGETSVTNTIAQWEDGLRVPISPNTFEWWYFDAIFDDGSTAVMAFHTKDGAFFERPVSPTIQFNLGFPDGTYEQWVKTFDEKDASFAGDRCDVHIGPNSVHGDLHTYDIHAEGDGIAADLTLTGVVPPFRVGPALTPEQAAQQWLGEQVVIPSGTVTGTITHGGQSRQVSGTCYHDHQWGYALPASPAPPVNPLDRWYWGRFHAGDFSVVFAEIFPKPGVPVDVLRMFILARNGEIISLDAPPLEVSGNDDLHVESGATYSSKLELDWSTDRGKVHAEFTNPHLIAIFGGYLRLVADVTLTVEWDGESSTDTSRGIWEVMHF